MCKIDYYITIRNYMNKGMGETNHVKYITYLLSIGWGFSGDFGNILAVGFAYIVASFFIGALWDKFGYYKREAEWGNRRNPFVKDMRTHINKRR